MFISPLDFIFLLISLYNFFSVILLCFFSFTPLLGLSMSFSALLLIFFFARIKIYNKYTKYFFYTIPLLFFAILLRVPPHSYIFGGQDQGVYVSIASMYKKTKSPFYIDDIRKKILPQQQNDYDRLNQYRPNEKIPHKYEGSHLPGFHIVDLQKSLYVHQFYPLHPLYMSTFSFLFGNNFYVYSLLFFSILGIFFLSLLARELSPKKTFSFLVTFSILTTNPLLCFFSKFPVSEIVSLAYSSAFFYYIARYLKKSEKKVFSIFNLFMIVSASLGIFFNHINGLIYIPLLALFFIMILCTEDKIVKKQLGLTFIAVGFVAVASLLYAYFFSFPYLYDIFWMRFSSIFGRRWAAILTVILSFSVIIGITLLYFIRQISPILRKNKENISFMVFISFITLILYHIIKNLELFITYKLSLFTLPIPLLMIYCPFSIVIVTVYFYFFRNTRNTKILSLSLFILYFLYIRLKSEDYISYYYYSRYYVSELIPYLSVAIGITLGQVYLYGKKKISIFIALTLIISSLYLTSFQMQKTIGLQADQELNVLESKYKITSLDLIFLDKYDVSFDIKTTLEMYKNFNVLYIDEKTNISWIKQLVLKYKNLYILTGKNFLNKNGHPLKLDISTYERNFLPLRLKKEDVSLSFYPINEIDSYLEEYQQKTKIRLKGTNLLFNKSIVQNKIIEFIKLFKNHFFNTK